MEGVYYTLGHRRQTCSTLGDKEGGMGWRGISEKASWRRGCEGWSSQSGSEGREGHSGRRSHRSRAPRKGGILGVHVVGTGGGWTQRTEAVRGADPAWEG